MKITAFFDAILSRVILSRMIFSRRSDSGLYRLRRAAAVLAAVPMLTATTVRTAADAYMAEADGSGFVFRDSIAESAAEYPPQVLLIARVVFHCGGESYYEKLTLAEEILRRIDDPLYPDTLVGVVYQEGEFPEFIANAGGAAGAAGAAGAEPNTGNGLVEEYTLALRAAITAWISR